MFWFFNAHLSSQADLAHVESAEQMSRREKTLARVEGTLLPTGNASQAAGSSKAGAKKTFTAVSDA